MKDENILKPPRTKDRSGFEGPEVWLDCFLLYGIEKQRLYVGNNGAEASKHLADKFFASLESPPEHNVWFDQVDQIAFGADQTWKTHKSDVASFVSSAPEFLENDHKPGENPHALWSKTLGGGAKNFVSKYYAPIFGNEIICNDEIIYSDNTKIKKFKDSKILVVAGGPTAKEIDWDPEEYDQVFSCNHFYLNSKMNSTNVAFATIGGEIEMDKNNKKFHDYMSNNDTLLCFEDRHTLRSGKIARNPKLTDMKEAYGDRCVFAHSRYRGKPGAGLRLINYAVHFGAKEVHFVGVDGMSKETKRGDLHNHAFQPNKKYSHRALNYGIYRRHYVLFWDYIINYLKAPKKVKFQNLGEGHEKNQTTSISKHLFPLEN